MDDLIKDALTAEAAEAPFPVGAWERQRGLLAAEGLLGGTPPRPVAPSRRRTLPWGELVAVAALLVLTLGLGLWGRPAPQQAAGGESPPVESTTPPVETPNVQEQIDSLPATGPVSPQEFQERFALAEREFERLLLEAQRLKRLNLTGFTHLSPDLWALPPGRVVGLRPVEGVSLANDPRSPFVAQIDQIVPKLHSWLAEAVVVNVAQPLGVVAQPVFYLDLADGGVLWFGLYNDCLDAERPNCPLVIGGTGRQNTQIVHPDLWRWLDGRAWQQVLFSATHPPTGRHPWTGPLQLTEEGLRTQINAEPSVVAAGLHVEKIMLHPRYLERLEADGKWRIYESPAWVIYLRSIKPTGLFGRIRMVDDLSGSVLWEVLTTNEPAP